MAKLRKNTDRQAAALQRLRDLGGEAIRHGSFFVAGGFNVAETVVFQQLADRNQVVIETVGASTFARISEPTLCRS